MPTTQRTLQVRSGCSPGVDLASKLVLVASSVVMLGLLGVYWFEILCTVVAILLVWVPVRLAGLVGQAIGAGLDAEIARRGRQDELVRLLLRAAHRERGT